MSDDASWELPPLPPPAPGQTTRIECPDCGRALMALENASRCLCPNCCVELLSATQDDGQPIWAARYLGDPEHIFAVVPRALPDTLPPSCLT